VTDGASPARSGVSNVPRLKVNRDPEKERCFLNRRRSKNRQLDRGGQAGPFFDVAKLSEYLSLGLA